MAEEKISVSIEIEDKFTSAFNKLNDSLKVVENNLTKVQSVADQKNKSMDQLASTAGKVAIAFAGLSIIKNVIGEFQSAEMAQNKLNKAFENSAGGIALTKNELIELGKKLEDKTLFGGEAIASVQTRLIAFKNIGGDAFKRATELALDFASATGQDASQGAMILGKALSNPIEGLGALKKAGVDFNFAQEQTIEKIVRSGDILKAQDFILKELESRYKGQAEAQTKGAGAIAMMGHSMSQLSEEFGKAIFEYLEPFFNLMNKTIPVIKEYAGEIVKLALVIGGVTVALNAATIATTALAYASQFLTRSNLILAGISAAVWLVVKAFENWGEITLSLKKFFAAAKLECLELIKVGAQVLMLPDSIQKSIDESIAEAKEGVQKLKKEEADIKQKAALDEQKRIDQDNKDKLQKEKDFLGKVKTINEENSKDKKLRLAKEKEEEFQKKLLEYDRLSKEDIKFLREEEKRQREQKTKNLKLQRQAYGMLSKDDKDYLDDKAKFELIEDNKQFKKDQALMKRKMKLTVQYGTDYANHVMQKEQQVADQQQALAQHKADIENNIGSARLDAAKDFFNQMGQLQSVKTREAFEIAKAANIATAVMNAYTGISETLKAYPFPISAVMAAAQGAIAFAQVQNISSQSFAEGGVVGGFMGATSGPDTTTVNARPGEMFLNAPQQRKLFDKINGLDSSSSKPQVVNHITNVKMYGNGDKTLKKMVEKTIETTEKRKLQKKQFVNGRFAT